MFLRSLKGFAFPCKTGKIGNGLMRWEEKLYCNAFKRECQVSQGNAELLRQNAKILWEHKCLVSEFKSIEV